MKKLALGLITISLASLPTSHATAHVLLTDETGSKGAILHIMPDDDPIAGQSATIFFDLQESLDTDGVSMEIKGPDSNNTVIELKIEGNLATTNYIFPTQGVYQLEFLVGHGSDIYTFKHSQRISRGATAGATDKPSQTWAEILLLASGIGIIIVGIVAFNRRKEIAKQSRF